MKNLAKEKDTLLVYLMIALAEAVGAFLFVCGFMHITITEIGRVASVGYVVGMAGIFFALMLLFHVKKEFECEA